VFAHSTVNAPYHFFFGPCRIEYAWQLFRLTDDLFPFIDFSFGIYFGFIDIHFVDNYFDFVAAISFWQQFVDKRFTSL